MTEHNLREDIDDLAKKVTSLALSVSAFKEDSEELIKDGSSDRRFFVQYECWELKQDLLSLAGRLGYLAEVLKPTDTKV